MDSEQARDLSAEMMEHIEQVRLIGRIPVRNIWLLMLYASDLFRDGACAQTSAEESPDEIPDLVAEVLSREVERRLRRNLSFGYQRRAAVLGRVRGRIDILDTERGRLLDRGRVACSFDELTVDTPRNRYVKAALKVVANIVSRKELAHRCRSLATTMGRSGVADGRPSRAEMAVDRFGRHDGGDRRMVWAAQLAFDLSLPSEEAGYRSLTSPRRDEFWIRKLYEKAVVGFYEVALSGRDGWNVRGGRVLAWQIEKKTAGIDDILPSMRTDIVIDHAPSRRRIVIDTKFNALLTRGWHREETVRSAYLYQIYAYLRSQVGTDDLSEGASGILLHPSVGAMIDERVAIQGHDIRFTTVNLATTAAEIRKQLLNVLNGA